MKRKSYAQMWKDVRVDEVDQSEPTTFNRVQAQQALEVLRRLTELELSSADKEQSALIKSYDGYFYTNKEGRNNLSAWYSTVIHMYNLFI